jgi:hypothetical protein
MDDLQHLNLQQQHAVYWQCHSAGLSATTFSTKQQSWILLQADRHHRYSFSYLSSTLDLRPPRKTNSKKQRH